MSAVVPFAHRGFFMQVFQIGGKTAGGVWLENERGESLHHKSLLPIFGRVTATHPSCRDVRVGDWCVFDRGRPIRVKTREGTKYVLDERMVLAIVQHPDGDVWFRPEDPG